jgi:hypothetical protein
MDQQSNECDNEEQHSNDGDDNLSKKEGDSQREVNEVYKTVETIHVSKVFSTVEVNYQNRNVLNLADNIWHSGRFIQYTTLPDNNLSCFFQNRAQYWRLGSSNNSDKHDILEKCSCCDFSYPSINNQQLSQNGLYMAKNNAITDSLLTFLKIYHVDFNNTMPNSNDNSNINGKHINNNNNKNSSITGNKQRVYNNNAPYTSYQVVQQQQQQQQYQNCGYQSNMNGFNHQINSFNNNGNGGGYNSNGTTLLNVINQSRNITNAFQQTMNNTSRYYNNTNNINNGYGLYKQF